MSAAARSRDAKVHKKNEMTADAAQKLWHFAHRPLQPRLLPSKTNDVSGAGRVVFAHFQPFSRGFFVILQPLSVFASRQSLCRTSET